MSQNDIYELFRHNPEVVREFIRSTNDGSRYVAIVKEDVAKRYTTHYEQNEVVTLLDMENLDPYYVARIHYALIHLKHVNSCYIMVDGRKETAFEMVVKE